MKLGCWRVVTLSAPTMDTRMSESFSASASVLYSFTSCTVHPLPRSIAGGQVVRFRWCSLPLSHCNYWHYTKWFGQDKGPLFEVIMPHTHLRKRTGLPPKKSHIAVFKTYSKILKCICPTWNWILSETLEVEVWRYQCCKESIFPTAAEVKLKHPK